MESGHLIEEVARRDSAVTAIRHVLADIAAGHYAPPAAVVSGLASALDAALDAYADAFSRDESGAQERTTRHT